jgi:CBS domain containing-hemolysin-like protein
MDGFHVFLAVLDLFVWVVFLLLGASPIAKPARSLFELTRLQKSGDNSVQFEIERLTVFGRLQALRKLLIAICLVAISLLSLGGVGVVFGSVVILGVLLVSDRLSQTSLLRRAARSLYERYERPLVSWALGASWLEWFVNSAATSETVSFSSKEELTNLLNTHHSFLTSDEYTRLVASLAFDERFVKDVMTPASMIDTARSGDVLGPLVLDELHKTGHSRFPVIESDIHHIVGVLYVHDILNTHSTKRTVKSAMEADVHYIHEDQSLSHALHGFLRTRRHLFIVVNDYRETVGVVSLEDVLETLIGKKIVDEFDRFDDLRLVAESNPHKNNLPKGKKDI